MAAALTACATNKPASETTEIATADSKQTFAFSLFDAVNGATDAENFCISPASAQWALAMTANGASGTTAEQMYKALGYPEAAEKRTAFNLLQQKTIKELTTGEHATVKIANSIWVNNDIKLKKSFIEENERFYDAMVESTNFDAKAVKEINAWCSEKSEGKIKSILDEADPATKLLLINALYFKAQWAHPFTKELTQKQPFTKAGGEKTEVPMMRDSRVAPYYEDDIIQATERYFERGDYSMILILPRENISVETATKHFAKKYGTELFGKKRYMLSLAMPKFRIEFGTSLKPMLKEMGMNEAFTAKACFDGISKTPLAIDNVIQKTFISVDETGAEAAAVTAVQMMLGALPREERKSMTINRPFIYAIKSAKTGELLFIGKVGNPNE